MDISGETAGYSYPSSGRERGKRRRSRNRLAGRANERTADSPIRPNKYCVNVNKCDATWYHERMLARCAARPSLSLGGENGGAPTESICRPDDGRLMYRRTGAPLDLFSPRAPARRSSSRLSFFLASSSSSPPPSPSRSNRSRVLNHSLAIVSP